MKKNSIDLIRVLAIFTIVCGMLYFYANIFIPRLVPKVLRIGSIRRPTTLLILGTDLNFSAETGEPLPEMNGRTDTILLMRIDPVNYRSFLLSIPRDSFVDIPGYGYQKINAANVFGGVDLLKKTLKNLTGLDIDYYIKVNPYAAVKLVDLLGGVDIYVDNDMYYVDRAQKLKINLKKGWHHLSGREAEGFIRFRHDTFGDIGRTRRQQRFLETVFRSFTRPDNLLKAPLAFYIAKRYIQTDLPFLKTIRMVNFARALSFSDIQTLTASGEDGTSDYAGSIWLLDRPGLARIIKDHF